MKWICIILIKIYRFFARDLGLGKSFTCVFYPSCSSYALSVLEIHPVHKAIPLILRRISRCHPWQKEHIDMPPQREKS